MPEQDFEKAKLIYRQLGYELVQDGGVAVYQLAPAFRAAITDAGGLLDGRVLGEYTINDPKTQDPTTKIGKVLDYLRDTTSDAQAYQLFWFDVTNYISQDDTNANGTPAAGEATDFGGNAAIIVHGNSNAGVVCAHELGHCMNLHHSTANIPKLLMFSPQKVARHYVEEMGCKYLLIKD